MIWTSLVLCNRNSIQQAAIGAPMRQAARHGMWYMQHSLNRLGITSLSLGEGMGTGGLSELSCR